MEGNARPNHFDSPDPTLFDQERLGGQDAGRPVESVKRILSPVRQNSRVYGALIDNTMRKRSRLR